VRLRHQVGQKFKAFYYSGMIAAEDEQRSVRNGFKKVLAVKQADFSDDFCFSLDLYAQMAALKQAVKRN